MTGTDPWTELARATPLAAPDVKALAGRLGGADPAQVDRAVEGLLDQQEGGPAAALLLASAVAGRAPAAALVGRALPLVDPALAPVLVGAAQGDRVAMLADVVGTASIDVARSTRLLLLAAALVPDPKQPPAVLSAQLRRIGRFELDIESSLALGAAAVALEDEGVRSVCAPWIEEWRINRPPDVSVARARASLGKPVLKALPASAPRVVVGAARSEAPKAGRNDPCPCGSGKKFKKCCEGKEGAPGAAVQAAAAPAPRGFEDFAALQPAELVKLDPAGLGTVQLLHAFRHCVGKSLWKRAEELVEVLAERADFVDEVSAWYHFDPAMVRSREETRSVAAEARGEPAELLEGPPSPVTLDEFRLELVDQASLARQVDVVKRQVRKLGAELRAERADLEVLEHLIERPPALAALEAIALRALREEAEGGHTGIDLAYTLLDHSPAIGLFFARGALDPRRVLDVETLLDDVEGARDRLGLPPEDRALDVWDLLRPAEGEEDEAEAEGDAETEEDPTVRALRDRLREATARSDALEAQLARRPKEEGRAAAQALPADPVEVRRLKGKIEKLEAVVAEGNDERRRLRDELLAVQTELAAARPEAEGEERDAPVDDEDEGEALAADERRGALVPVWSDAAARSLRSAERGVQRVALRVVGALAGGEPTAWSQAKRLQAAPDLSTARAGIHHRVLFKVNAERGELTIVDLINRKALESTIRRR